MPERSRLVGARLAGAEAANGQVLTFLDSHCKLNIQGGQQHVPALLSLSLHIKLTQAFVWQINHWSMSKLIFPSFNGSSSKIFRAGEDQDCSGLFRDDISCQNSLTNSGDFQGRSAPSRLTI